MDDKWRIKTCSCGDGTVRYLGLHGLVERDCEFCFGGVVWLRPSGHAFSYPGGPALGSWSKKDYEQAIPAEDFWDQFNYEA